MIAAACLALLYLAGVTGKWWPTPDSALYLTLAQSLAAGEGYTFNGHVNSEVTPGLPAMLAGIRLLFGKNFWAPNAAMMLLGLAGLWLVYLLLGRLGDGRTALAVTLATGFCCTYYFHAHVILTDIPFAAFFWLALYVIFARDGRSLWPPALAGLVLGAAVFIRAPGIILVLLLAGAILFDRRPAGTSIIRRLRRSALVLTPSMLVCGACYVLARVFSERTPLYVDSVAHRSQIGVMRIFSNIAAGFVKLPLACSQTLTSHDEFMPVGLVILALAVVGGVAAWKRGLRSFQLIFVMYVPVLSAIGGETAVRPRYLIPVIPLLLFFCISGLLRVICTVAYMKQRRLGHTVLPAAVYVFAAVIIACNAPALARHAFYYTAASYTDDYHRVIKSGRYKDWFAVSEIINNAQRPHEVIVGIDRDNLRVIHFLTGRPCVPTYEQKTPRRQKTRGILETVRNHDELTHVVVDVRHISESNLESVITRLTTGGNFTVAYRGRRLIMLEKNST